MTGIILGNRDINYFNSNIMRFIPDIDRDLMSLKGMDVSFLQKCGNILDKLNVDIDRLFMSYYLNDEMPAIINNKDFTDETYADVKYWSEFGTDVGVGTIEWGHMAKFNQFYTANIEYGRVIDIDYGLETVVVDVLGQTKQFTIDEIYLTKAFGQIRLGDILMCSRLTRDKYGAYGNISMLRLNRTDTDVNLYDVSIGVSQDFTQTRAFCRCDIKYKVNIDEIVIPDGLLDTAASYLKPLTIPYDTDTLRYISTEAISNKSWFHESYTTPSSGFNSGYFEFGNDVMRRIITMTHDPDGGNTNVLVDLASPYILYCRAESSFVFPASGDNLVFTYQDSDSNNYSIVTTLASTMSASGVVDAINVAVVTAGGSLSDCVASIDSEYRVIVTSYQSCIYVDSSEQILDILGIQNGIIPFSMSGFDIARAVNEAIVSAGIANDEFYVEAFDDGMFRLYSDLKFVINDSDALPVLGWSAGTYEADQQSIYRMVRDSVFNAVEGNLSGVPKLNVRGKMQSSAYGKSRYDISKYTYSDITSESLYRDSLYEVDDSFGTWQSIIDTLNNALTIQEPISEDALRSAITGYYTYYNGLYSVGDDNRWRNFRAFLYNEFDAIDIYVTDGKVVSVDITDVAIQWIENPYIYYVAHLLGWDIQTYSSDIKLINNTDLVRALAHVYKTKGTHYGYKFVFKLMGIDATIQELYRGFPLDGNFNYKNSNVDPRLNAFYDTVPFTDIYQPSDVVYDDASWQSIWVTGAPLPGDTQLHKDCYQWREFIKSQDYYRNQDRWYLNKSNRIRYTLTFDQWSLATADMFALINRWHTFMKPIFLIDELYLSFPLMSDKIEAPTDVIDFEGVIELVDRFEDCVYGYSKRVWYDKTYFNHRGEFTEDDKWTIVRGAGVINPAIIDDPNNYTGWYEYMVNGDGEWRVVDGIDTYTGTVTVVNQWLFSYDYAWYDGYQILYDDFSYSTQEKQSWIEDKLEMIGEVREIMYGQGVDPAFEVDKICIGFGRNTYNQIDCPTISGLVVVSAGEHHNIALKSDGSLVGWGRDDYSQTVCPSGDGFTNVSAGAFHSLALKSDGSLVGWGLDDSGQATCPAGTDYVAIAAGDNHSLALKSDGSLVGWGNDAFGQATCPAGTDYTAISGGRFHSIALKSDGSLVGWGYNNYGQTTCPVGTNYTAIDAGAYHNLAMKSDGSIVGWGYNADGQVDCPTGTDIAAITAGGFHSVVLRNGGNGFDMMDPAYFISAVTDGQSNATFISGGSYTLQNGIPSYGESYASVYDVTKWYCGDWADKSRTLDINYRYFPFVYDARSTIGGILKPDNTISDNGNLTDIVSPTAGILEREFDRAEHPDDGIVFDIERTSWSLGKCLDVYYSCSDSEDVGAVIDQLWSTFKIVSGESLPGIGRTLMSSSITFTGSGAGWGRNNYSQTVCPTGAIEMISAGLYHSIALRTDGSLVGWGYNGNGQITCPAGTDYIAIASGAYHNIALKSDGSLVGWGWNAFGQTTCPAGNDYVAIATQSTAVHNIALKSDGSLVGWGYNVGGQTICPAGTDYIAIAVGGTHSLALKSDGSIVGWGGTNSYGQITCPAGNDYVAIAGGGTHSLALKSDGSLVGWGNNGSGQTTCPAGNDYVAITAGFGHSLALKSDGSIVGWGLNDYGQTTCPVKKYSAISAGWYHNIAIENEDMFINAGSFSMVIWTYSNYDSSTGLPSDTTDLTTNAYFIDVNAETLTKLVNNINDAYWAIFNSTSQPFGDGVSQRYFADTIASIDDNKLVLTHPCAFMVLDGTLNSTLGIDNYDSPSIYTIYYNNIYSGTMDDLVMSFEDNYFSVWRNQHTGVKQTGYLRYEPATFAINFPGEVYDIDNERYICKAQYADIRQDTGTRIKINVVTIPAPE